MGTTGTYQGAVAFVTGGGSGIGRALSLELARRGARVTVTDIDGASAARVAAEIGASASAATLDVRDAAAVKAQIDALERIDLLFNNAGIGIGGEVQDLSLGHWDRVLDINVRGVYHGIVAAYPRMIEQRSGNIVNTASMAGLAAAPLLTPYAMSKHAVVGLSISLRAEAAAFGVGIHALCPSAVETPILDTANPADLPDIKWKPDVRKFLTKISGTPYPADKLATECLDAVAANKGVIVIPKRARVMHRMARWFPAAAEAAAIKGVASERRRRPG